MSKQSEDLQEWLVDNFDEVKDSIQNECRKWSEKHNIQKCKPFERQDEIDVVDIESLGDDIAEALETGLINVIKTYEETCDDCGLLKKECRKLWSEQRKCCPDCKCSK